MGSCDQHPSVGFGWMMGGCIQYWGNGLMLYRGSIASLILNPALSTRITEYIWVGSPLSAESIRIHAAVSYPRQPLQDMHVFSKYAWCKAAGREHCNSSCECLSVCATQGTVVVSTVLLARKPFSYLHRLSKLSWLGCGGFTHRPQLTCGPTNEAAGGATQARDFKADGVTLA